MPSRELTEILTLVPDGFADPDADYRSVRAMMAPFHGHPLPPHVAMTEVELGGVRCAWYEDTRRARRPDRVVFHCHGGGLVSSPLDDYHFYGAMLAEQLEARIVMADYRLAPEHVFPAAHRDCSAAYRGLLAPGTDPSRVVVSGDSCGGLLALGALLHARDEGLPPPACFLSISGWFDVSVPDPVEGRRDPFLTAAWVRNRGREYAAGRVGLDDPRLSPVYADLAELPPLYLPAGEDDTLRRGTEALARAALEAGVAVTAESWPGMVHGWQGLVSAGVPEAVAAFARARAYLDDLGV